MLAVRQQVLQAAFAHLTDHFGGEIAWTEYLATTVMGGDASTVGGVGARALDEPKPHVDANLFEKVSERSHSGDSVHCAESARTHQRGQHVRCTAAASRLGKRSDENVWCGRTGLDGGWLIEKEADNLFEEPLFMAQLAARQLWELMRRPVRALVRV